ncbi:LysR family transcriptional regulator [Asanoa ishikariensis]|uniref:DNA-binding transcriptional regulator, LysR family n=1 Tax=Asanoa ishikariensis TaxID=137265 RepID=A0A1H3TJH9_9ACTN|nr:LysR family transcriptional regulator [Asanoa ishikariensis]GIF62350.1 LysR family transcriptional regulator [Asanoa ishikariensis]SDZ50137.1 DNA-binding transcriptional regulator, LysR family [Asanoa ishikariensis]
MIDVQRLRVFREVARQGSFNRAAAVLRLTPSAVSQQISALERSLGAGVVCRSTRGIEVTEAGRVLVEAADVIAAELENAEREIARLADVGPRLTISTFASGGQRLLPGALTRFSALHPEVSITVLESEPDASLLQVRSGAADLALSYHFDGPPPVSPDDRSGLTWTPLLDDPMWVVLPAGHRLAARDEIAMADLAGERFVQGCLTAADMLGHYAALAGFEVDVACRSTDYVFAQALVRVGVGVSLIPHTALIADAAGLAMVPLEPPRPSRRIGVATARRRSNDPLTQSLLEALSQEVGVPSRIAG